MNTDQLNLFKGIEKASDRINFLNIIYNGQEIMREDEFNIFDNRKYNKLVGITYSVGQDFLKDLIKAFEYIDLVVGISNKYKRDFSTRGQSPCAKILKGWFYGKNY